MGSSLYVMITMTQFDGSAPGVRYGLLPIGKVVLRYRTGPRPPVDSGSMATEFAAALLASACAATQMAACRFARYSRITVRSACVLIAIIAMFFALWRSGSGVALLILSAAFGYSLASPIILLLVMMSDRELSTSGNRSAGREASPNAGSRHRVPR